MNVYPLLLVQGFEEIGNKASPQDFALQANDRYIAWYNLFESLLVAIQESKYSSELTE
jgi:hypothetical protein